ncbi:MAG TPA: UDP-N-acetylmuramate--L-alanine ligase [Chitinophagaceae bacterium]|nr:UDP-N-acetylmuramate--L-alanine ligase [Chitinophagaceae bacterium]
MIKLRAIKTVYFIGIGGIGMSAIARFFNENGVRVLGYDRSETQLTKELKNEGIDVQYTTNLEHMPENPDIVVYTPAIANTNILLQYVKEKNFRLFKRSEVLELISRDMECVAIAGTHGKTTITTMTAFILRDSNWGCNAFLGGISANYKTNFWSDPRNLVVVEADEYDRSFLRLHPDIAILSAVSADHLDIYGTEDEIELAFKAFVEKVNKEGKLIVHQNVPESISSLHQSVIVYGINADKRTNINAKDIRAHQGGFLFTIVDEGEEIKEVFLKMGGYHNVENALAAYAVGKLQGVPREDIIKALANFKGVKRRYEYIINENDYIYIDDYAHHPEELMKLLQGVKQAFPEKKIKIIFQPHLFSRTKSFYKEFGSSLSIADEVVLLPIFPARELPIEGVSSEMILPYIEKTTIAKVIESQEEIIKTLKFSQEEILISAGAGDVDKIVDKIREKYLNLIGYEEEK